MGIRGGKGFPACAPAALLGGRWGGRPHSPAFPLSPSPLMGEGWGGGENPPFSKVGKTGGPTPPVFPLPLHLPGRLPPRAPGPRFFLTDPSAPGLALPGPALPVLHRPELVVQRGAHLASRGLLARQTAVFHHGLGRSLRPGGQGQAHHQHHC
jgi:hypothetical protein